MSFLLPSQVEARKPEREKCCWFLIVTETHWFLSFFYIFLVIQFVLVWRYASAVLAVAQCLCKLVVAEWIELVFGTEASFDLSCSVLREFGCHQNWGYWQYWPLDLELCVQRDSWHSASHRSTVAAEACSFNGMAKHLFICFRHCSGSTLRPCLLYHLQIQLITWICCCYCSFVRLLLRKRT